MSEEKLPAPVASEVVGYGRPPAEHRFQKGKSGNPNGRPRGTPSRPKSFDPVHQPTDNLILHEAYRPVTIRKGERTIELPAIQAAVRAHAISAMKGSRLSQRALDELEKKSWDERLARRAEAQCEVSMFAEKFHKARSEKWKTMWRLEWHFEQRTIDIINDCLPQRYKAKLENRSYAEGASREGKALAEITRDWQQKKSKRKFGYLVEEGKVVRSG